MARAIITVDNKTGLAELAEAVAATHTILSGGGTGNLLTEYGIEFKPYQPAVVLPETSDRRFRWVEGNTIAGVMADPYIPGHLDSLAMRMLAPVEFVICNLRLPGPYGGDDSGAALIGAAASNWKQVTVLVYPLQYDDVLYYLRQQGGVPKEHRRSLARAARNYLSDYQSLCWAEI